MVKNPPADAGDTRDVGLIPRWGRSPGEGKGYPLQDSGLENSMDCTVHGVTKSRTQQSDFHFHTPATPLLGIDPEKITTVKHTCIPTAINKEVQFLHILVSLWSSQQFGFWPF